jgi:hypothetical protein
VLLRWVVGIESTRKLPELDGCWSFIHIPPAEGSTLLGQPDLGHELGHQLYLERPELAARAWQHVDTHLTDLANQVLSGAIPIAVEYVRPKRYVPTMSQASSWTHSPRGHVLQGVGYQHVRLSATVGNSPFPQLG